MREMSKLAWAYEDSHRRVRAAMLRKGGSPEDEFRPGDMVSFKRKQRTGGWVGPARVIAREDKNYWLANDLSWREKLCYLSLHPLEQADLEAIDLTSTSGSRWTTLILPWTLHR